MREVVQNRLRRLRRRPRKGRESISQNFIVYQISSDDVLILAHGCDNIVIHFSF